MEIKSEMVNWIIQSEIWWIFLPFPPLSFPQWKHSDVPLYSTAAGCGEGWVNKWETKNENRNQNRRIDKISWISLEKRNWKLWALLKTSREKKDMLKDWRCYRPHSSMLSGRPPRSVDIPNATRQMMMLTMIYRIVSEHRHFSQSFFSVREWNFEKLLPILSVKLS